MFRDKVYSNVISAFAHVLLAISCSNAYSSEQVVSEGDCNVQIQGSNVTVDMTDCGSEVNNDTPKSNLEVVEILTSNDSILDLGLRDSGKLIAFVNGIQLVFGPMYCGSNVCMPGLGFTKYTYNVKLSNGKAEILHRASIEIDSKESLGKKRRLEHMIEMLSEFDSSLDTIEDEGTEVANVLEPKYYEYLSPDEAAKEMRSDTTSSTIRSYSGGLGGLGDYEVELHNLTIKKAPVLRISHPVGPNDITRLKIDLEFPDKELYLSSCINTCSLDAHAVIYYDSNKALKTDNFGFYFSNLGKY